MSGFSTTNRTGSFYDARQSQSRVLRSVAADPQSDQIRPSQIQKRRLAADKRRRRFDCGAGEPGVEGAKQGLLGAQLAYGANRGRRRALEAGSKSPGSPPISHARCNRFSVDELLVGTGSNGSQPSYRTRQMCSHQEPRQAAQSPSPVELQRILRPLRVNLSHKFVRRDLQSRASGISVPTSKCADGSTFLAAQL